MDQLRVRGLKSMEAMLGPEGWGELMRARPELYAPQGQEAGILQSMADMAGPGGYAQDPATRQLLEWGTGQGLDTAFKDLYDQVIGTELANSATLGGLGGRGGAGYGEFANRYMLQSAPQIFGMKSSMLQALPGMQGQTLSNMGMGAQAAGAGRQGNLQDWLNRMNLGSQAFLGAPFTTAVGSSGWTKEPFSYRSIGEILNQGSQVTGMVGGAMGCWIARALFGDYSHKASVVRFKATMLWPRWAKALYCTFGPAIAKTPMRYLFKPYFERLVVE